MVKLALIFLGVCFVIVSQNPSYISILNCVSLLLLMVINRDNVNVVHLCAGLLLIYLAEMILFEGFIVIESGTMSQMRVNTIIYSTHLLVDLVAFLWLIFRAPFTRARLAAQDKPYEHVFIYNAEFALSSLFVVFMCVDLLALGENFIRHLDEFGVSTEIAEIFSDWTVIFYSYSPAKSVLLGITFLLLWMMAYPIGQDEYQQRKPVDND